MTVSHVSAIASGQIVACTGRYKLLILGSLITLAVGLFLLTHIDAATDRPVLWIWMVIAGLGIGPSFAVFTLVVQNSVPPNEIGVASSSLTFFQQIHGTVGLTIAQTLFTARLLAEISVQMARQGVRCARRLRWPSRSLPQPRPDAVTEWVARPAGLEPTTFRSAT